MNSSQNSRLLELIEYARQTALMRNSPPTEVDQYRNFLEYENSLQNLPGVTINAASTNESNESDEIWLAVERLRETSFPQPQSKLLKVWLDVTNDPNKIPTLKSSVTVKALVGECL